MAVDPGAGVVSPLKQMLVKRPNVLAPSLWWAHAASTESDELRSVIGGYRVAEHWKSAQRAYSATMGETWAAARALSGEPYFFPGHRARETSVLRRRELRWLFPRVMARTWKCTMSR